MGKHRLDDDAQNTRGARAENPGMGVLARAVALQETGLLVHGMNVTDLLTGVTMTGVDGSADPSGGGSDGSEAGARQALRGGRDIFAAADGELTFRGSSVALSRLEALRELVYEALDARREREADIERAEREHPRTQFPWGIGLSQPDVVVTGLHGPVLVEYLRAVGLRARQIDAGRALEIAAALHEVEQEIQAGSTERGDEPEWAEAPEWTEGRDKPHDSSAGRTQGNIHAPSTQDNWDRDEPSYAVSTEADGAEGESTLPQLRLRNIKTSPLRAAVAVAALLLCVIGGGISAWAVRSIDSEHDSPLGRGDGLGGVASGKDEATGTASPTTAPGTQPGPWREHHVAGDNMQVAAVPRAEIPVALNLPDWRRVGATSAREEFHSEDPDMRILVSAAPTPLTSQADLDRAVVQAVESTQGVRLAGREPVSYEETYPDSTTLWHVRLVDGHQISVGCQFRQVTAPRLEKCTQAANSAGLDKQATAVRP